MNQHNFNEAKDFVLGLFLLLLIVVGYGITIYLNMGSPATNTNPNQCIVVTNNETRQCR